MKLCDNCLEPAADVHGRDLPKFPLGRDKGTQRDPWRASLDLCLPCQTTLGGTLGQESVVAVDLAGFHARWVAAREVTR